MKWETDQLLFETSLLDFLTLKYQCYKAPCLDWTDNGCTASWDRPFRFNFRDSCLRHDFGYHNYYRQHRLDHERRKMIDEKFRQDLRDECNAHYQGFSHWWCKRCADIYYVGVRGGGRLSRHKPPRPCVPGKHNE